MALKNKLIQLPPSSNWAQIQAFWLYYIVLISISCKKCSSSPAWPKICEGLQHSRHIQHTVIILQSTSLLTGAETFWLPRTSYSLNVGCCFRDYKPEARTYVPTRWNRTANPISNTESQTVSSFIIRWIIYPTHRRDQFTSIMKN